MTVHNRFSHCSSFALLFILSLSQNVKGDELADCLAREVLRAGDKVTVAQIKQACSELQVVEEGQSFASELSPSDQSSSSDVLSTGAIGESQELMSEDTIVDVRENRELSLFGDGFSILLHRDNYILPYTHNYLQSNSQDDLGEARELDAEEIKFQISLKTLLLKDLPFSSRLFAAYTNQSHWQAYNNDDSNPFRETNHQPELFLDIPIDAQYRGIKFNSLRFALNHQSNGRSGPISRSWNRAYAELLLSTKYSELNFRSWWQVTSDSDNPDILDYLGRFQIDGLRTFGRNQFHLKLRHTLSAEDRGALQLGFSRGIGERDDIRWYLQYFDGYGESLIDYNRKTRRIGVGFKVGAF